MREPATRVESTGYVAGIDPVREMVAVAKAHDPSVHWREGIAEVLPFPDGSFDAVMSQFGLMFSDRNKAIREMLRVLTPNGRSVIVVWDSLDQIPAYATVVNLLESLFRRSRETDRSWIVLLPFVALVENVRPATKRQKLTA